MTDSCATCFFYRSYTSSRSELEGIATCRSNAPERGGGNENPFANSPWPVVWPDEWCGDGKDIETQRPFSSKAYSPSAPANSASFSLVAANTVNVVDAACSTASVINAWQTSGTLPPGVSLRFTPHAGNFDVFTSDGSAVTGTWTYFLY